MNYDTVAAQAADEIVALLTLCQQLQSEKDSNERQKSGVISRDEDEFAERICVACGYALQLRPLLSMMNIMSSIGVEMERRGEITVFTGESYSHSVLENLMTKYLSYKGSTS